MDSFIKSLEEVPLPDITDIPGTEDLLEGLPEVDFDALGLPNLEELDRLEAEMLPELERIELEMLPELERLELEATALPVEDHPLQAKAPAAGADPGEDQKGGSHNATL